MSRKLYAIGDIHGCLDEFEEMLNTIHADRGEDDATIVFLGDYVDRGPKSAQVLHRVKGLIESSTDQLKYVGIRGNHEDMMLACIRGQDRDGMFIYNGGQQTIKSYEDQGLDWKSDEEFLIGLPIWYKERDVVFVHACLPPYLESWDDIPGYEDSIIWNRSYVGYQGEHFEGVFVVHGHTPVKEAVHTANQINIDTGCVFGNKLTAIRINEDRTLVFFEVESSMPKRF